MSLHDRKAIQIAIDDYQGLYVLASDGSIWNLRYRNISTNQTEQFWERVINIPTDTPNPG